MRPLLLVAIVFASMLSYRAADARDTSTPAAVLPLETSCGAPITIDGIPRSYPPNLEFLSGCETYDPNTDQYTISARYSLPANLPITTGGEDDSLEISQFGVTQFTVIEGSLNVTVTQLCAFEPGCAQEGAAYHSTVESDGSVTWETLAPSTAVTLAPGESVWLENVTATFRAGDTGVVFSTFGVFLGSGGAGCGAVCFHGP
jgi:hypothetical protein